MKLLLAVLALTVGIGSVSASTMRFHLKAGETLTHARRYYERGFNRQRLIDGTTCRFNDGTTSSGWLHVSCVGRYTASGAAHRFSAVYTPLSCKSMRLRLTISGVASTTRSIGWSLDSPLRCRRA